MDKMLPAEPVGMGTARPGADGVRLRRSGMLAASLALLSSLWGASAGTPDAWVPARWEGGPVEVARRAKDKTLPDDPAVRETIDQWYRPETLSLLEGTPVNCLLVTFSAGVDAGLERQQQNLVKAYVRQAHDRGIVVLGVVYFGSDVAALAARVADARLDGVVLEGDFPDGDHAVRQVEKALRARRSAAIVIRLGPQADALRAVKPAAILAVKGAWPQARELSEMGITASASSQPWIDSNIWLVRSLRAAGDLRPVWISYAPRAKSAAEYQRAVADAAIAGGHWVLALDDGLRASLLRKQPAALEAWRRVGGCLKFYQEHADWREFLPQGPLGIVLDRGGSNPEIADEYLNLIARRQVPYRVIERARLGPAAIKGLAGVLIAGLPAPTDAERKVLLAFAEEGGLVVAGSSWGTEVPRDQPFAEMPSGKGRIVVYRDDLPDPESVSRDMPDLLRGALKVWFFNTPSVLAYASSDASGERVLLQLLNYGRHPSEALTVRLAGEFRTARLFTPESAVTDLPMDKTGGRTEIFIPAVAVSGALLLER